MDPAKLQTLEEGAEKPVAASTDKARDTKQGVKEKRQPWKDFFETGAVATQPVFNVVGDGSIRLGAELDDKDLGG